MARSVVSDDCHQTSQSDLCDYWQRPQPDQATGGRPAATTQTVGKGRVTYVGTVPSPPLARALAAWAVPNAAASDWLRDPTVTIASGATTVGRVWFVSNWGNEAAVVRPPIDVAGDGAQLGAGSELSLAPWEVKVLFEDIVDSRPDVSTNRFEHA